MTTPPWIRIYRDLRHKAKVQRLPDALFKTWINLLCSTDDDGALPEDLGNLAFELRMRDGEFTKALEALVAARLFVKQDGRFIAHDWNEHQKRSDVSTGRVKRHREKLKALRETGGATDETVSETPPDTEQNRADADTDQSAGVRAVNLSGHGCFEEFWEAFPHRPDASLKLAMEAWVDVMAEWAPTNGGAGEFGAALVAAAKSWAQHVAGEDARRRKGDPMPRSHAHNWLREARFATRLGEQKAESQAEAARHAARMAKIPDGPWRDVAERFAAAHGWTAWDGATGRAKLLVGERQQFCGAPLIMEFDMRASLDRCVEAKLAEKICSIAAPLQVELRTRPRVQPAPMPDGRDPLEIPERLRRVAVVEAAASEAAA